MSNTPDPQGPVFEPSVSMSTGDSPGPYEDELVAGAQNTFNQYIEGGPSSEDIRRSIALKHAVDVVSFSGQSFRDADAVLAAAQKFDAFLSGGESEQLTHNEGTLHKVYQALIQMPGATEQDVVNAVSLMQNDGILFRERVE